MLWEPVPDRLPLSSFLRSMRPPRYYASRDNRHTRPPAEGKFRRFGWAAEYLFLSGRLRNSSGLRSGDRPRVELGSGDVVGTPGALRCAKSDPASRQKRCNDLLCDGDYTVALSTLVPRPIPMPRLPVSFKRKMADLKATVVYLWFVLAGAVGRTLTIAEAAGAVRVGGSASVEPL